MLIELLILFIIGSTHAFCSPNIDSVSMDNTERRLLAKVQLSRTIVGVCNALASAIHWVAL